MKSAPAGRRARTSFVVVSALVFTPLIVVFGTTAPAQAETYTTPCITKGTQTSQYDVPADAVGVRVTLQGQAGLPYEEKEIDANLRLYYYGGGSGAQIVTDYTIPGGTRVDLGRFDGGVGGTDQGSHSPSDSYSPASKGGDAAYIGAESSDCTHVLGVAAGGGGAGRGPETRTDVPIGGYGGNYLAGTWGGDAGQAADGSGAHQGAETPHNFAIDGGAGGPGTLTGGGAPGLHGHGQPSACYDGYDGVGGSQFQGGNGAIGADEGTNCDSYGSAGGGAGYYGGGGGGSGRGDGISGSGGGGASFVDLTHGSVVTSSLVTDATTPVVPTLIPIYQPVMTLASVFDPVSYATQVPLNATFAGLPPNAGGTVTFTGYDFNSGQVQHTATVPVVDGAASWTPPSWPSSIPLNYQATYSGDSTATAIARPAVSNEITRHFTLPENWVYATGTWDYGQTPTLTNGVTCTTANGGTPLADLTPGDYVVDHLTCSGGPAGHVNLYYVTVTVNKPVITVQAQATMKYGDTTPTYNIGSVSPGFPSGITLDAHPFLCETSDGTPFANLSIGTHSMKNCISDRLSGANRDYYQLNVISGAVFVDKGTITVTPYTKHQFGTPFNEFTYIAPTPPGVYVGGLLTCALTTGDQDAVSRPIGTYGLRGSSCSGLSLSGAEAGNYRIAYADGTLDVTAVDLPVTITGTGQYGNPTKTFQRVADALPTGVAVAGTPTCTRLTQNGLAGAGKTITATSHGAGSYTVDGTSCTGLTVGGANGASYALRYVGGDYTVAQATPIAIRVTGTTVYGNLMTLAYTATNVPAGFTIGGDLNCVRFTDGHQVVDTIEPAGSYNLDTSTCGGLFASGLNGGQYGFTFTAAQLTVTRAPLTVTASNAEGVYRSNVISAVTPSYSGFVNGDDVSAVTTPPLCNTHANTVSAGFYPGSTYCVLGDAANYDFTFVAGDTTVDKIPVSVFLPDRTYAYGDTPPTISPFELTYVGFLTFDNFFNQSNPIPSCSTNTTSATLPGVYPSMSSCSGAVSNNYSFTYFPGKVTVTGSPLTVTAPSPTKVYGDAVPTLTPTYSDAVTTPASCTTTATASSPVGTYPVTCSGAVLAGRSVTYAAGKLTVSQAPVTVSPVVSVSESNVVTVNPGYDGLVLGEDGTVIDTPPTCSSSVGPQSPAGTHLGAATCQGGVDDNYSFTYQAGDVTLRPTLTIGTGDVVKVYGAPVVLTPHYDGFQDGDSENDLFASPATCTSSVTASTPAQQVATTTCSGATSSKYRIIYGAGSIQVTAAPLTITATTTPTVYGTAVVVTPSYDGFVLGQGPSVATTLPICSSTAGTGVGTYPAAATCSGAVVPNYSVSDVASDVVVTPRDLTVTASDGTNVYGSPAPAITPIYSGFASGDNPGNSLGTLPVCTSNTDQTTVPGAYADTSTCASATSDNYAISYTTGAVTVTKAVLTVTGISPSRLYGAGNPALPPSITGYVNSDAVAALTAAPTCSTAAVTSSPVASYPVTCAGGVSHLYSFDYHAGSLSITQAPLTITAGNAQPTYGDNPGPVIVPSYSGFVAGDDSTSLSTKPTCASHISPTTSAGAYPGITTCSGAVDTNYLIDYATGNITITKAPVSVIASDGTQVYGATVKPTITPSYSGLRNGESPAVLGNGIQCVSNVTSTTPVGVYPNRSSCSGATSPNYVASYPTGTVTITKAPVVITAGNTTSVWGTAPPVPVATFTGFKNGQTRTTLTTQPTCVAGVSAATNAGTYGSTTSCSGAAAANYSFSYVTGTAVITKANLVIVGSPVSIKKSAFTGKITFSAKVTNASGGLPIAGVPVNFATTSILLFTLTCTGVTNALGVATCTNSNGNLLLLLHPSAFSAKAVATANYNAGSGTGKILFN